MKGISLNRYIARGFTIVELLIVIVVIGILAAITIATYTGVQERSRDAKRESDLALYSKVIMMAREASGKTLMDITGSTWSLGLCSASSGNPANVEPRYLPTTHGCWVRYYDNLSKIGVAAGVNLDQLKGGDGRGNPYVLDENEGEGGVCSGDTIRYYAGDGTAGTITGRLVPTFAC